MVKFSWGYGRLSRQYLTHNWSDFSAFDICDDSSHICQLNWRSATPSPWLLAEWYASFCCSKQTSKYLWVCVLTYFALLTCTSILTQKRIVRTVATAIEVLLTLIRFIATYKTHRIFGDGIRGRTLHMQTSTRLLYVFTRDGTLLFIPWVQKTIYHQSNWWPIYSVSWVSLDCKTSGL